MIKSAPSGTLNQIDLTRGNVAETPRPFTTCTQLFFKIHLKRSRFIVIYTMQRPLKMLKSLQGWMLVFVAFV